MRNGLIALVGLVLAAGQALAAEGAKAIDSGVIHNYKYLSVGYGYLHEIADSDVNAHGGVATLSYDEQGILFSFSGGYFFGEDEDPLEDLKLWSLSARMGYVVRLLNNRINIIPNVGGAYEGVEFDVVDPILGTTTIDDESWSVLPGVGASFAINNQFAIHGAYAWGYNFDAEEGDHLFNAGGTFALREKIGLTANAHFSDDFGFTGATASIEFHY